MEFSADVPEFCGCDPNPVDLSASEGNDQTTET
jgi:hypothetical protein